MKDKFTDSLISFIGMVTVAVGMSFLLSYPYMVLWNNCLVPAIPGLAEVEWLQMWGITILAHGLFRNNS